MPHSPIDAQTRVPVEGAPARRHHASSQWGRQDDPVRHQVQEPLLSRTESASSFRDGTWTSTATRRLSELQVHHLANHDQARAWPPSPEGPDKVPQVDGVRSRDQDSAAEPACRAAAADTPAPGPRELCCLRSVHQDGLRDAKAAPSFALFATMNFLSCRSKGCSFMCALCDSERLW